MIQLKLAALENDLTLTLSFPGEGTAIVHWSVDQNRPANPARPLANQTDFDSPSPGKERAGVRSCALPRNRETFLIPLKTPNNQ